MYIPGQPATLTTSKKCWNTIELVLIKDSPKTRYPQALLLTPKLLRKLNTSEKILGKRGSTKLLRLFTHKISTVIDIRIYKYRREKVPKVE